MSDGLFSAYYFRPLFWSAVSVAGKFRKKRATYWPWHLGFSKNASESDQDLSSIRSLNFKIWRRAKAIFALRTADKAQWLTDLKNVGIPQPSPPFRKDGIAIGRYLEIIISTT